MTRKAPLAPPPAVDPALVSEIVAALIPVLLEQITETVTALVSGRTDAERDLKCYTPAEAAALLGVTENWVNERVWSRRIPCTFVGRFPRLTADHIRAIRAENEVLPRRTGPGRARRTTGPVLAATG